jgi:hypothetical protein
MWRMPGRKMRLYPTAYLSMRSKNQILTTVRPSCRHRLTANLEHGRSLRRLPSGEAVWVKCGASRRVKYYTATCKLKCRPPNWLLSWGNHRRHSIKFLFTCRWTAYLPRNYGCCTVFWSLWSWQFGSAVPLAVFPQILPGVFSIAHTHFCTIQKWQDR